MIFHSNVEDEDDPYVAEAIEALEARRIDLIDESHTRSCILDEARLARSAKLFAETRLEKANRLYVVLVLLLVHRWSFT